MADKNFIVENGVLTEYTGDDGYVVIPEGIVSIGEEAFSYCRCITDVILPYGVVNIGDNAFYGCTNLKHINIPESITSIGRNAFCECNKLEDISVPESVTDIGEGAFCGCELLQDEDGFVIVGNVLYDYFGKDSDVVIPDGVLKIGYKAFKSCERIICVKIPESITEIGKEAFGDCCGLKSINLPDSITCIPEAAFFGCISLVSVKIPESVVSIGNAAFYNCVSLSEIFIPNGVEVIEECVFYGCISLKDEDGFIIVGDVLYGYCGKSTSIAVPDRVVEISDSAFYGCDELVSAVIPYGVKRIGSMAFSGCSALVRMNIPVTVTEIGDYAFECCFSLMELNLPHGIERIGEGLCSSCTGLESIIIPYGVTEIGDAAFSMCSGLSKAELPDSIIHIGKSVFCGCKGLKGDDGFVVVRNVLYGYFGKDSHIVIPDGVTGIDDDAFADNGGLIGITVPESVTGTVAGALCGFGKIILKGSGIPSYFRYDSLPHCNCVVCLNGDDGKYFYAYSSASDADNLSSYVYKGDWNGYDNELICNGPVFRYSDIARILGAFSRLVHPIFLTDENRKAYLSFLAGKINRIVPIAQEFDCPEMIRFLIENVITEESDKRVIEKLVSKSKNKDIAELLKGESKNKVADTFSDCARDKGDCFDDYPAAVTEYIEKYRKIKGDKVLERYELLDKELPSLRLKDGRIAPPELFRFIFVRYACAKTVDFIPEADAAADLVTYDSLCCAIDTLKERFPCPYYPVFIPFICRFGNAVQMKDIFSKELKNWSDRSQYGSKGRTACNKFFAKVILNDTREAAIWLEKQGRLAEYAEIRGKTEERIYNEIIFDFGFDEDGKRYFDIGTTVIELTLTERLTVALYDSRKGKAVKTVPKRGVDPEVYKMTSDSIKDITQTLKKAARIKNNQLFAMYLDKYSITPEEFERYLANPFLRRFTELLVWVQDGKTFTVIGKKTADVRGNEFILGESPIILAHPMEMDKNNLKEWQDYFTARGLAQAFVQVWEPVYERTDIKTERYKDCKIPFYFLTDQEKRGIFLKYDIAEFEGFAVKAFSQRGNVEIEFIYPKVWNRRSNNIVYYLDRVTVYGRIAKDDVSVRAFLPNFTLAQISDFLRIAGDSNAVNVMAILLEYKEKNFGDYNVLDEFSLE